MEKEQNQNPKEEKPQTEEKLSDNSEKEEKPQTEEKLSDNSEKEGESKNKELSPEEKIKELKDKLTRAYAEMENQRRRFEKEKDDAFDYGGFAFAREALNLVDNLERSKQSLANDENLKNSDALKKTLEHLDIINKDLISIFEKNNIKPIDAINKKLDPNFHQAMMEIEDNQKEPGIIIQEIQKGFLIKDRLLRPSLVGVSKKSSKNNKKSQENQDKFENK